MQNLKDHTLLKPFFEMLFLLLFMAIRVVIFLLIGLIQFSVLSETRHIFSIDIYQESSQYSRFQKPFLFCTKAERELIRKIPLSMS